jgi:hypothetical protein
LTQVEVAPSGKALRSVYLREVGYYMYWVANFRELTMGKFGNVLESACMTNPTKESGSQVSQATKVSGSQVSRATKGVWYQVSRPDSSATIVMKIIWWAQNTKTSATHGNMSPKLVLKSEFSFCTTPISTWFCALCLLTPWNYLPLVIWRYGLL